MGVFGGYRAVRRLGSGSRAEVWLGRDASEASVALKVYRPDVDFASVDREMRALARVDSPHVTALLDAAIDDHTRPCLVLPRLDPGGLSRLLAIRTRVSAGELVTLIVPLARAVSVLHANGVVHGDLRVTKVLLDSHGAPVLVGGGRMGVLARPPAPGEQRENEALLADRRSLAQLSRELAGCCTGGDAEKLSAWLSDDCWKSVNFTSELVSRAFDLASPEPLRIPWNEGGPPQLSGKERLAEGGSDHRASLSASGRSTSRETLSGAKPWKLAPAVLLHRALRQWASVRPRFRVLAVAGVVALLALGGLAFSPQEGQAGASEATSTSSPKDGAAPPAPSDSGARPPADDAGDDERDAVIPGAALSGDDPVAAGQELLRLRDECFERRSTDCLELAVQRDSAAWDTDTARMSAIREGTLGWQRLSSDEVEVSVVDVMGGVVLLEVRPPAAGDRSVGTMAPASVLIIRTEAGWRIRDVFEA
ncbi:protein kinase [Salinibacterium sp. SYSU T00001]|uniref:protein kinase domain-containing protein n=1 Tax=Homoserinimonas sedimenticola TaxID=2986805 RepID=UPI002235EB1D|nr:protein kinase [Salinibacterium sedimenticola]MCW4384517.1 protein kinase [Salinibacterium sedimenticola]